MSDDVRSMPYALGPEKGLLSLMLDCDGYICRAIESGIVPETFYMPSHSTLYGALCDCNASERSVELVSLIQYLLDKNLLDQVGGPAALADILTYACGATHRWPQWLADVRDKATLRGVINAGSEMISSAYDSPGEAGAVLDAAEASLSALRESSAGIVAQTVKQAVAAIMEQFGDELQGRIQAGLKTGFSGIDQKTGGMKPGDMFVIAARPSMGKTSLMMNIVENIVFEQELPALVFSLEMTLEQLCRRVVFSRAKYSPAELNRGIRPDKSDLRRIRESAVKLASAKIEIDDTPGVTISYIRAKARRMRREKGISLIAIDYLQLCHSITKQSQTSREREVSEISAGIKGIAKELGIPVILLAQLNRGPESRTGKAMGIPRLSDLRESGSVEQDADMVGLLYRASYYAESDPAAKPDDSAVLDLAKNRNGETGKVYLTFNKPLMRFEDGNAPDKSEQGEGVNF